MKSKKKQQQTIFHLMIKARSESFRPSDFSQFFEEDDECHSCTPKEKKRNSLQLAGLGVDVQITDELQA